MKTDWKQFRRVALVSAGLLVLVSITRVAITADAPADTVAPDLSSSASNSAPAGAAVANPEPANASVTTSGAPLTASAPAMPAVRLSKSAAEIAKLAQAGLGDDVMLAYVANVNSSFNLGSDQILYLNDLGISPTVVKSMILRDAALKAASVAARAGTTPPPPNPIVPNPADATALPPPPPVDNTVATIPPYDTGDNANAPVTEVDYFYNSLAPYGSWVFIEGAGACWQPTVCRVNREWRPYNDRGRWLYSDCGWYWQSDYSWGWAAFHYGRWFEVADRGWCWAPDHVWAPAWVSWRHSADYCGWAPLPPAAHFAPGVGFTVGNQAVSASFEFGLKPEHYTFIPIARLSDLTPARYAAPSWQVRELHSQTALANHFAVQNNRVVNQNIDPKAVAALARTEIRRVDIRQVPGAANQPIQPERLTKGSGSLVLLTPQLPAPAPHQSVSAAPVGARAPFVPAENPGQPRNSFNPPPSSAPATLGSAPPAYRPQTYPAGSLVLTGRRDAFTPSPPNPAVPPPNSASAGFNFNGNYNRPNFNERLQVQPAPAPPQTAYATPPAQSAYVIPGRFTVSQQMSAPRYNGGYGGGGTPMPPADQSRPEPAPAQDPSRFHPDNSPQPFRQRSEPPSPPFVPQPTRQDMPTIQRAEAAQHFAPPAPAPSSPQPASTPASSSSSSSSTASGHR